MFTLGLGTKEFNFLIVFESNSAALVNVSALTALESIDLPRRLA
jgi:hypothetical protein